MWRFFQIVAFILFIEACVGCPSVCSCKWKGGKETTECQNNGLAALPPNVPTGTQVLNLNGNNLQHLPRRSFSAHGLINLQKLFLSSCNIGEIDPFAFQELSNLVELDLSHNLLTEIPFTTFRETPALKELILRGNQITFIPAQAFAHTPSLIRLDISHGLLKLIDPLAFQALSHLETVKLQNNRLSELPRLAVKSLENCHGIELHNNPWMCDCRALPMWRLLEIKNVPHPSSPECRSPSRVKGKKFSYLVENDFACPPEILPVGRFIEGVAGENATITCPVEGQPSPKIVWFLGDKPLVNNSLLASGPQRVFILTDSTGQQVSRLIITGAQEADSGLFRCVAVNPAGKADANFTLAVTMRQMPQGNFQTSHIAGITIGLLVLLLLILVAVFLLVARIKSSSQLPTTQKVFTPVNCGSPCEPNPVQKPPRVNELLATTSSNPDVISEAERSTRSNNNMTDIPNGNVIRNPDSTDNQFSTQIVGFPETSWKDGEITASSPIIHEHYNPGYISHDFPQYSNPMHSTPFRSVAPDPRVDPQAYGYPVDYGLPIPEVNQSQIYASNKDISSPIREAYGKENIYMEDCEISSPHNDLYYVEPTTYRRAREILSPVKEIPSPPSYSMPNEDEIAEDTIGNAFVMCSPRRDAFGPRGSAAEGAESPKLQGALGERPWIPGSHAPPNMPLGVAVLPPLPSSSNYRIKSRDSPDEGYQEGTEV